MPDVAVEHIGIADHERSVGGNVDTCYETSTKSDRCRRDAPATIVRPILADPLRLWSRFLTHRKNVQTEEIQLQSDQMWTHQIRPPA